MTRSEIMALVAGVEGWLSPREGQALYRCARGCQGRGVIVEIGSWQGRSTIVLAAGSQAGSAVAVHAVDPHLGLPHLGLPLHLAAPTLPQFRANLDRAGAGNLVKAHVRTSADAARDFTEPVELIYIDGGHDHATVLEDFTLWFPKVVDGGVMAFHDTVRFPGPRRVVRDCVYRSRHFRRIRFAGSLTYAEKVAGSNTVWARAANAVRWRIHQTYAGAILCADALIRGASRVIRAASRVIRRRPPAARQ